MSVEFFNTSKGVRSCKVNNFSLHSSYDPEKEAERFVENTKCNFTPKYVLVIEPALSYCAKYFRKKYPKAVLCAVHLSKDFQDTDSQWDKVFIFDSENQNLEENIFAFMGDEGIVCCLFCEWVNSVKAYPQGVRDAWSGIKKAILKTRNVLNTRSYFSKRWSRNALRFCLFSRYNAYVLKGNSPVIVCASGPSLKDSFPYLKKYRDNYFLLAVSSALTPLINEGIIPDLCISTDGGFWAKHHLALTLNNYNIPLALPLEGACFADILHNKTIVPISYGDGPAEALIQSNNYINVHSIRNGTVSGTAASFALSISSSNVYFCGLDLSPSKGFGHTQPNELEINESVKDNRLRTTETRVCPSTFFSPSLDIYRGWFSTTNFFNRVFRLSNSYPYKNKLGQVYDVDWNFFEQQLSLETVTKPIVLYQANNFSLEERIKMLIEEVKKNKTNKEWIKSALPSEEIIYQRTIGTAGEKKAKEKIEAGMEHFINSLIESLKKGLRK